MATIRIERGEKSYRVWSDLTRRGVDFVSYRLYSLDPGEDQGRLAFDIDDERVAVELVLRYG